MRFSAFSAALVACVIGFGGTLALVLAAADAVDATQAQTASWVTAVTLMIAIESAVMSWRTRMPVVSAWTAAGLALIGASTGFTFQEYVGASIITGLLLVITGLFRPLADLVSRIPQAVSAGMLAGVLLPFVLAGAEAAELDAAFVLPLVALYFAVRFWQPSMAVIAVLVVGIAWTILANKATGDLALEVSQLVIVMPEWTVQALLGLAIPLYLVTMASQNLPGLAVLQADGYRPAPGPLIAFTGALSVVSAPFCASTTNLSAVTAAICTGPEAHPDPDQRWQVGLWYGFFYLIFAVFGASLVALIGAMPLPLIMLATALALVGPLANALKIGMAQERGRFAAVITFAVTASGVAFFGVGSAFWGLLAGTAVHFLDQKA